MSFRQSLREGSIGEHAVWNMLQNEPNVRNITDVRNDKRFQEYDVDFLVENIQRQISWIEVKTDNYAQDTMNIVYESKTCGNIGCFEKTQSDFIAYYIPKMKTCFLLKTQALKDYVRDASPDKVRMGDGAEGYLLYIRDLKTNGVIKKTYSEVY